MGISPQDIAALRDKYEAILRLRTTPHATPRAAMIALAEKFPGALRELDEMPEIEVRRRIEELNDLEKSAASPPLWAVAIALFHRETRGALCAKKWLGKRRTVTAETITAFEVEARSLCYVDEAKEWQSDLAKLASPPRGRVTDVVFERMATELAVTAEEAKALAFPSRKKS